MSQVRGNRSAETILKRSFFTRHIFTAFYVRFLVSINKVLALVKDRHQWLGRELQCAVSWSVDMLFYNVLMYIVYH